MKTRVFIVTILAALAFPALCWASAGGFIVGRVIPEQDLKPWLFGENPMPPAGCRTVTGWRSGNAPMGAYKDYKFNVRVHWCWKSESWVNTYQSISGRRFAGSPKVTAVWWSDTRGVEYDDQVQTQTRRYTCVVEGRLIAKGCFTVRVTGQVRHSVLPVFQIGDVPAHPWLEFSMACDGTWLGGDFSTKSPF